MHAQNTVASMSLESLCTNNFLFPWGDYALEFGGSYEKNNQDIDCAADTEKKTHCQVGIQWLLMMTSQGNIMNTASNPLILGTSCIFLLMNHLVALGCLQST